MGYYTLIFNRVHIQQTHSTTSLQDSYSTWTHSPAPICPHHGQCIYPQVWTTGGDVSRVICATPTLIYLGSRESRGARHEFLLPYSPDLNPIEEAFSAIKQWLQRNQEFVDDEFRAQLAYCATDMLLCAVFTVTEHQAQGWFCHSGYMWWCLIYKNICNIFLFPFFDIIPGCLRNRSNILFIWC